MTRRLPAAALLACSVAAATSFATGCNKSAPITEDAAPAPAPDPRTSGVFAPLPEHVEADAKKVALGRQLYHDTRLSGDGTLACASCHSIPDGGDDGAPTSTGIRGQLGPINSPTVLNSGFNFVQFWDGRAADLQAQAAGPVANPLEMGADWPTVVARVAADADYVAAFADAYPGGVSQESITDAIAEFERTLVTPSRFDAWLRGDDSALTDAEKAGFALFNEVGCQACHNGVNMGGATYQKMGAVQDYFAARGTPLTDADNGRFNVTNNEADRHFFKVPTLRNVALTAPYFHDAHATTLPDAVRTMAQVQLGRTLEPAQVDSIVAFLGALTGEIPDVALPVVPQAVADGSGDAPADGSGAPPADGSAAPM
ncbi:MAG: c-type cytochrome [Myxococcales bacterium]|nr:c-type cytochrome [Myxococcales bacterium]